MMYIGDFNFQNEFEINIINKYNYIDLWLKYIENINNNNKELIDKNGYTWDSYSNSMINMIQPWSNKQMRLDRIVLQKESKLFNVNSNNLIEKFEIFGKENIGFCLYPSDHFGIYTQLKINCNDNINVKNLQKKSNKEIQNNDTTETTIQQSTEMKSIANCDKN